MESQNTEKENLPCPLGRGMANFRQSHHVAFTLNLPCTRKFMLLTSDKQKAVYLKLLRKTLKDVVKIGICRYDYRYEYCKNGKIHMHGYIIISKENSSIGYINDFAKKMCYNVRTLNHNKVSSYDENKFYSNDNGITYKGHDVYLDFIHTEEAFIKWYSYMVKDEVDVSAT